MLRIFGLALLIIATSFLLSNDSREPYNSLAKFPPRKKLSKAELAIARADYEFLRTRDPKTNSIPFGIKIKELEYVSNLPSKEQFLFGDYYKTSSALLLTHNWRSEGPSNVTGRILSVETDFDNDSIILAGSASGGLWKSTDFGANWQRKSPLNDVQSVTCIVQNIAHNKRNIWYYGTGELLSTTDRRISIYPRTTGIGNGIFKSIDSGETWQPIPSTRIDTNNPLTEVFQGIWSIVVDTTQPENETIFAACYGGIMRSSDGGENWSMVLGDSINKPFSTYIIKTSKNEFYAAVSSWTTNGLRPIQSGIFYSNNGINWTNITPPKFPDTTRIVKLCVSPFNNKVIYVITEAPIKWNDPVFSFSASKHTFWRYSYNEITGKGVWVERTKNLPGGGIGDIVSGTLNNLHGAFCSLGGYALTLAVHPFEENTVFIGGANLYRNFTGFADSNYTTCMGGYPYDFNKENLHPDIHAIKFLKSNINTMIVASDGGIFMLENCLQQNFNWNFLSYGLLSTQFYWVSIDKMASWERFIAGGIQDNGIFCTYTPYPSTEWDFVNGGDGMTTVVANNKEFIISSFYNGFLVSFRLFNGRPDSIYYITPSFLTDDKFTFYTNFALDLNDNKTLYLAAKNIIWRQNNIKAIAYDSSLIETGWEEMLNTRLPNNEVITSISISKQPANILYYGTDKGRVFRINNANTGNPTPVEITSYQFPQNAFVSCIDIDSKDANKIFVVFSNYNVKSIFYSSNGGNTWTHQSGNLEEYPDGSGSGPSVRWVKSLHTTDGIIYFAGTSAGLFSTINLEGDNTIWVQEGKSVIGNAIVDMIDARETDGLVVVATQGSGVFSTNIKTIIDVQEFSLSNKNKIAKISPYPADDFAVIDILLDKPQNISITIFNMKGKKLGNLFDGYVYEPEKKLFLNTFLFPSGNYYLVLKTDSGYYRRILKIIH